MSASEFYRFEAGVLVPCNDSVSEIRLATADSFLVENGMVRSLEQHLQRFGLWAREASPAVAPQLADFLNPSSLRFLALGAGFPGLNCTWLTPTAARQPTVSICDCGLHRTSLVQSRYGHWTSLTPA